MPSPFQLDDDFSDLIEEVEIQYGNSSHSSSQNVATHSPIFSERSLVSRSTFGTTHSKKSIAFATELNQSAQDSMISSLSLHSRSFSNSIEPKEVDCESKDSLRTKKKIHEPKISGSIIDLKRDTIARKSFTGKNENEMPDSENRKTIDLDVVDIRKSIPKDTESQSSENKSGPSVKTFLRTKISKTLETRYTLDSQLQKIDQNRAKTEVKNKNNPSQKIGPRKTITIEDFKKEGKSNHSDTSKEEKKKGNNINNTIEQNNLPIHRRVKSFHARTSLKNFFVTNSSPKSHKPQTPNQNPKSQNKILKQNSQDQKSESSESSIKTVVKFSDKIIQSHQNKIREPETHHKNSLSYRKQKRKKFRKPQSPHTISQNKDMRAFLEKSDFLLFKPKASEKIEIEDLKPTRQADFEEISHHPNLQKFVNKNSKSKDLLTIQNIHPNALKVKKGLKFKGNRPLNIIPYGSKSKFDPKQHEELLIDPKLLNISLGGTSQHLPRPVYNKKLEAIEQNLKIFDLKQKLEKNYHQQKPLLKNQQHFKFSNHENSEQKLHVNSRDIQKKIDGLTRKVKEQKQIPKSSYKSHTPPAIKLDPRTSSLLTPSFKNDRKTTSARLYQTSPSLRKLDQFRKDGSVPDLSRYFRNESQTRLFVENSLLNRLKDQIENFKSQGKEIGQSDQKNSSFNRQVKKVFGGSLDEFERKVDLQMKRNIELQSEIRQNQLQSQIHDRMILLL